MSTTTVRDCEICGKGRRFKSIIDDQEHCTNHLCVDSPTRAKARSASSQERSAKMKAVNRPGSALEPEAI